MSSDSYTIDVSVQPVFLSGQSSPEDDRYVFAYTVTMHNSGSRPAQLLSRHWVITDGNGKVEEVRGSGVVGEQPHLAPGESYTYTSGTVMETPVGTMEGSYRFVADDLHEFDAPIPLFSLKVPHSVN